MMNHENRKGLVSFLTGAAMGAVTGVAAGVLLAPKPGKQTRKQVADWLEEKREAGGELIAKIR